MKLKLKTYAHTSKAHASKAHASTAHAAKLSLAVAAVSVAFLCGSCTTPRAPLFDGMGKHGRKITTTSELAQRYFDQGLVLTYGFNHDEAVRSFEEAARLDPDCAMAYWGQALALGPNINLPMDEAHGIRAFQAIQKAQARKARCTQVEQGLIHALATRYQDPPPADRAALDKAYAEAMAALWAKYPDDADIGTLYAEALMDLSPWDFWHKDGKPKVNTLTIAATLERVFAINPMHPGANHYYIHTMEASKTPEKALPAADRLRGLVPGAGHLVHMPAHIYVQTGRFKDSADCNAAAVEVDRAYFKRVGQQGIYHTYHAHNHHFLVYSAMFQGRYEVALQGSRELVKDLPEAFLTDPGIAEFLPMACHVHVRFGRWEEVLKEPKPRQDQPYAVAMWHYARGMAYANTDRIEECKAEIAAFEVEAKKVPKEQTVFIVPAHDVFKVARSMLAGELLFRQGKHEEAFQHLRQAVQYEDALRYSEPSPWMQPARHALGALLLQDGKVAEAEACYREDLEIHPGNGWALHGLSECLERRSAAAEAADVKKQFDVAWADATVKIKASCFCRRFEKQE